MDPNFAALMSKAKANTQEQHGLASAKQAELEERRKKEAELEKRNAARERERRAKELEARQRRDQERLQLEERLRQEREKKRALKPMQQQEEQNKPNQIPMPKKGGKVPSSTERIPAASSSSNFKGDSLALKKKRRIDAMFSDDEGSSDATSSRKAGSARHHRLNSTGAKSNRMSHLAAPSDNLSAKEKLKLEFDPSALRSLNENRKDVRTIEEIEQDLRRKQALAQPASAAPPPSQGLFASRRSAGINSQPAGGSSQASSSALAIDTIPKDRGYAMDGKGKGKWPVDIKRKRTASPTEDSLRKPSSKLKSPPAASVRQRDSASSSDTLPKLSKAEARRQEIWAILNPHKANAPVFGYNDDDFSDEDMEAGIDDIEEEDRRAVRIARLEDKKEEERLKQRAKEKAARKSGAKQ